MIERILQAERQLQKEAQEAQIGCGYCAHAYVCKIREQFTDIKLDDVVSNPDDINVLISIWLGTHCRHFVLHQSLNPRRDRP